MQIQSGRTVSLRDINCSVFCWWLQPDGQTNWGSALMIILNGTKVTENHQKFKIYTKDIPTGQMVKWENLGGGSKLVRNYYFSFVFLYCTVH
jgi:hypothetical protein